MKAKTENEIMEFEDWLEYLSEGDNGKINAAMWILFAIALSGLAVLFIWNV